MKVLVTGANGFVGKWLCADLLANGHTVLGAVRERGEPSAMSAEWQQRLKAVEWLTVDLMDDRTIGSALERQPDAVVHLAAMASGARARAEPRVAWEINCVGTARLAYAVAARGSRARLVMASTGEVYGRNLTRPATESDPVSPCSPYAASKAGAELVLQELHRRLGTDVVIARPFQQTGPGQAPDFVVPAFARRILEARGRGERRIVTGDLSPVREFIDVRDAAAALRLLVERGQAGGVYNIACGEGVALEEIVRRLAQAAGWECETVPDPALMRPGDIHYLVGDGARVAALGWTPRFALDDTLRDAVKSVDPTLGAGA